VRLSLFARLPIEIDVETSGRAWRETLVLARAERLTLYDGAYLELAMRRGLPLATTDRELAAAAKRVAVAVLP
jgi:predicted nucleic acid-binding protein